MKEDKKRILKMIEEGKITAEEAVELLNAIEEEPEVINLNKKPSNNNYYKKEKNFLKIKVIDEFGKEKVNVNIPLKILKIFKDIQSFMPNLINEMPEQAKAKMREKGIDLNMLDYDIIKDLIDKGLVGEEPLLDIECDNGIRGKSRVQILTV